MKPVPERLRVLAIAAAAGAVVYLVALHWSMRNVYAMAPGEVYWAASDIGWAVGHSYIVWGPLTYGCTSVLYEGKPVGTPDAGAFWRVIAEHAVAAMFTAPTAFRAIRREDPEGKLVRDYDLRAFRTLFLAGERADPETLKWAEAKLGVPVIDHWWQTETGWRSPRTPPASSSCRSSPARRRCRCRATTCRSWPRTGRRSVPASSARWRCGCRYRRVRSPRSGTPTRGS